MANGYEATVLVEICRTVLRARDEGTIHRQQLRIAKVCEVLLGALENVAIVALVDEATGYQEVRPKDALQQYLEKIIRKELAAWSKKFPDEFYENIYKLRGWPWTGMSKNRYSAVAHYTCDLVYERIAPALLDELKKRSPLNEKGERRERLHQWLSDDVGNPMLSLHLQSIMTLQKLALMNRHGWKRFMKSVDMVMPRKGSTLELPLGDLDEQMRE